MHEIYPSEREGRGQAVLVGWMLVGSSQFNRVELNFLQWTPPKLDKVDDRQPEVRSAKTLVRER